MAIIVDPNVSPRIITVPSPATGISVQDLVDLARDWEDQPENLEYDSLLDATGKENLGGGVKVGITVTLQNAKLAFEARLGPSYAQCTVSGGNLVAVDALGNDTSPIQPTAYTQVVLAQSTSAALIEDASSSPWAEVLEGAYTAKDILRLMASILVGDAAALGGPSTTFKSLDSSKVRVSATIVSGNRTVVGRDPT